MCAADKRMFDEGDDPLKGDPGFLPEIQLVFGNHADELYQKSCGLLTLTLLKIAPAKLLVPGVSSKERDERWDQWLKESLPYLSASAFQTPPLQFSLCLLCRCYLGVFRFFHEMMCYFLVPGKRLNILHLHAVDFRFPHLSPEIFTLAKLVLAVEDEATMEEVRLNLPSIQTELRLGAESEFYARRILEVRGLRSDAKTAMIQEYMARLVQRLPLHFNQDIFTEIQHVLVKCPEDFKTARDFRHLSRIVGVQYLFRHQLRQAVEAAPTKRHVFVKLVRTRLRLSSGNKKVLGCLVGLNFFGANEVFDDHHLMKAIHAHLPEVRIVEGSFFENTRSGESLCTLYLEVEKPDDSGFTAEEIRRLQRELPVDLKEGISRLVHPLFMPRNEEEIMRNILMLSHQVKYTRDLPQVVISFDEQKEHHLLFNVVLLRVLKPGDLPIRSLVESGKPFFEYMPDRVKSVGFIRKKYPKEVTVFRAKVSKERFLRRDHSIDLHEARRFVAEELSRVLGEYRDYNGGMISKQNELLEQVRMMLETKDSRDELLLDNFFYSLTPVLMRSVIDPAAFTKLFLLLLEEVRGGLLGRSRANFRGACEAEYGLALVASDQPGIRKEIVKALLDVQVKPLEVGQACVVVQDVPCVGYIYRCDDPGKRVLFLEALEQVVRRYAPAEAGISH